MWKTPTGVGRRPAWASERRWRRSLISKPMHKELNGKHRTIIPSLLGLTILK
jgi:hypothetical protein